MRIQRSLKLFAKNKMSKFNYIRNNTFIITSDQDWSNIKECLYGYQFKLNDNDKLNKNFNNGHYVHVKKDDKIVSIEVDNSGMGMIFECKTKDFYAYSNSFVRLVESVKNRVNLTINEDFQEIYSNVHDITTPSYKQTIFNEITLLPSNIIVNFDLRTHGVFYSEKKYQNYIALGTEESYDFIDSWAKYWIQAIRILVKSNMNINLQLSGGFDSRLILGLFIASGIDFKLINIESSNRMEEDFEIANQIAKYYNFKLNSGLIKSFERYEIGDEYKNLMNTFYRFGLHKQFLPGPHYFHYRAPLFVFSGYGNMRGWYNASHKNYINHVISKKIKSVNKNIEKNIHRILTKSFNEIYYDTNKEIPLGGNFINYAYNFTRGRYNYGSGVMAMAGMNQYICAPILDLEKIKPISSLNDDYNLLFAYIYCLLDEDLLKFRFNNNRSIDEKTINLARLLAKKHKINLEDADHSLNVNFQDNVYGDYKSTIKNIDIFDHLRSFIYQSLKNKENLREEYGEEYVSQILAELSNKKLKWREINPLGLALSLYAKDATTDKLITYLDI